MSIVILTIVVVVVAVACIAWIARKSMLRGTARDFRETGERAEAVLAQLARGEQLAPDVELLFPAEHLGTGNAAIRIDRERFLRALRAGPYRRPTSNAGVPVAVTERRGSWASDSFSAPPVSQRSYILADGQGITLFARQHGKLFQVAIVSG